ncbi:flagellar biosynthesis repressor FlbT [Aquabacter cavernae]|uniref:flagellar biosynthesis repressor FlbT n=1 Tax=Aquabacter cavernae TaxID=2496029 RepID=UPI0013DF55C3|nr:flagellar biosynthesis repressor FlbT [Aquabacter cavernae]
MTKPMRINLKPGERIFINGAVVRVDRKVTLELMNDVCFLLESHVLQVEDTTTPLRQLYFTVQAMLIDPRNAHSALGLFQQQIEALHQAVETLTLLEALAQVEMLVTRDRLYEALRQIRCLFAMEDAILAKPSTASTVPAAPRAARVPVLESTL